VSISRVPGICRVMRLPSTANGRAASRQSTSRGGISDAGQAVQANALAMQIAVLTSEFGGIVRSQLYQAAPAFVCNL
jgi:hypothetical protein